MLGPFKYIILMKNEEVLDKTFSFALEVKKQQRALLRQAMLHHTENLQQAR